MARRQVDCRWLLLLCIWRNIMKTLPWISASLIAFAAASVTAAPASQFSAQRLSDTDKFISSDAFEGRGPATRAETKTINYIADQFRAVGLQPAGDSAGGTRSWFQNVPLLKSDIVGSP